MKYLNTWLVTAYVVLIILLMLTTCDRPEKKEPVTEEEEPELVKEEETVLVGGEEVNEEEVEELPPCEEGCEEVNDSEKMIIERPFNMGANSGEFVLNWETYGVPDQILVYNCLPRQIPAHKPIFDSGMVSTTAAQSTRIRFNDGPVITIVGKTGAPSGSAWWYCLECVE